MVVVAGTDDIFWHEAGNCYECIRGKCLASDLIPMKCQQISDLVWHFHNLQNVCRGFLECTNAECGRWDLFQSFVCSLMVAISREECVCLFILNFSSDVS